MKLVLLFILLTISHAFASQKEAICYLSGLTSNPGITGVVKLSQKDSEPTLISAYVSNLPDLKHGFHLHTFGDVSSHEGGLVGGHFDPLNVGVHGCPSSKTPIHKGDLGNLEVKFIDKNGNKIAFYEQTNPNIDLSGEYSVIGRSLAIHAIQDPCNATTVLGGKIATCVIGCLASEHNEAMYDGPDVLEGTCLMVSDTNSGVTGTLNFTAHFEEGEIHVDTSGLQGIPLNASVSVVLMQHGDLYPATSVAGTPVFNESTYWDTSLDLGSKFPTDFQQVIGRSLYIYKDGSNLARCVVGIKKTEPFDIATTGVASGSTTTTTTTTTEAASSQASSYDFEEDKSYSKSSLIVGLLLALLTIVGIIVFMVRNRMMARNGAAAFSSLRNRL